MSDPDRDQEIHCEHKPSPAKLDVLGIDHWPLWRKEVSKFPWRYAKAETCYILRGRFRVTPEGGEPREFRRGDLISFPAGLTCAWEILEPVEKHYRIDT
ncbi:MAG: cupin domain-containing protein [Chromatiaceae bacterium]|nr:cupin domain-containing protein [Chromatiaceae bacterium]